MSRHRSPSPPRLSITVVLAGAALGATALLPGTAHAYPAAQPRPNTQAEPGASAATTAGPGPVRASADESADDSGGDGTARESVRHRASEHRHAPRRAHTRPMTSGERQYRNGCRQGYILDGCEQFDVRHLLRRGINPFL